MADPAAYSQDDDTQKKTDELLHGIGLHPAQQRAQEYLWQHAQARGGPQESQGLAGGGDLIASNNPPAIPQPVQPVTKPGFKTLTEDDFRTMQQMGQDPSSVLPPGSSVHISGQPTQATPPSVTPPATTPSRPLGQESLGETQQQAANIVPTVRIAGTGATSGVPPAIKTQPTPLNPNLIASSESDIARDLAAEQKYLREGSGIHQIKNPFLRTVARVGDVAGTVFFPSAMAAIPGTTLHHEQLVGQAYNRTAADVANREKLATTQEAVARGQKAAEPTPPTYKELTGFEGPGGSAVLYGEHGEPPQTLEGTTIKPPTPKEGEEKLTDAELKQAQGMVNRRWALYNPNQPVPPDLNLIPGSTRNQVKYISGELDKLQTAEETKETHKANEDMRRAMLDIAGGRYALAEQKQGMDTVIGTDPKSNRTVSVPLSQADKLGITDYHKASAAETEKIDNARTLLKVMNSNDPDDPGILQLIDRLDARGELGPIASRFNEFLAGTWGKGADPDYVALRTKLNGLNTTALMQVHVGNRGSYAMLEHFQDLANAGKMDGATMRQGVRTELNYVNRKAMLYDPNATREEPSSAYQSPEEKKQAADKAAAEAKRQKLGGGAGTVETPKPAPPKAVPPKKPTQGQTSDEVLKGIFQ